jgi:thiol-disulfide isomerase/thioredoxin
MSFSKSERIWLWALVFILVVALVVFGIWYYKNSNSINESTLNTFSNQPGMAPYSDLFGKPVALDEYLGQPMVVITWASWSPFSEGDMRTLSDLSNEFANVSFLAINRKEPKEQAQRYMNSIAEVKGVLVVLDPRDVFYSDIGGYAMPEVVVYNAKGEIVLHERGVADKDKIRNVLQGLASN